MGSNATGRLKHIVLADPESQVRLDLGRTLLNLAETVDRFSEGDDALAFIKDRRPEIAIVDLKCWLEPDSAINQIKAMRRDYHGILVVTHRKLLPRHLGRLNRIKIEHVIGHPLDPLLVFQLAHERYGIIARRHTRVQEKRDVFWGGGPQRETIGYTTDISRGGMLMVSDKALARGSSFFFGIDLGGGREVEMRTEVRYVDDSMCAPDFAYGLSFVDIKTTTAMLLDEYILELKQAGAAEAPITFNKEKAELQ